MTGQNLDSLFQDIRLTHPEVLVNYEVMLDTLAGLARTNADFNRPHHPQLLRYHRLISPSHPEKQDLVRFMDIKCRGN